MPTDWHLLNRVPVGKQQPISGVDPEANRPIDVAVSYATDRSGYSRSFVYLDQPQHFSYKLAEEDAAGTLIST